MNLLSVFLLGFFAGIGSVIGVYIIVTYIVFNFLLARNNPLDRLSNIKNVISKVSKHEIKK